MNIFSQAISIIFALACIATTILSYNILGPGMWGWIILGSGVFVGVGQYFKGTQDLIKIVAIVLSIISVCAVLLGLIAATIGGSFKLDGDEALLLFMFAIIAISGVTLSRNKSNP